MSTQKILVDSDVFVGFFKKEDSHHKKVIQVFEKLKEQHPVFYVSNYVFSESITVISQRVGHKIALNFINFVKSPTEELEILRLSEELEEQSLEVFKRQTSKNVSFVDCTNIALFEAGRIDVVFSFDEIYKKNGVKTV